MEEELFERELHFSRTDNTTICDMSLSGLTYCTQQTLTWNTDNDSINLYLDDGIIAGRYTDSLGITTDVEFGGGISHLQTRIDELQEEIVELKTLVEGLQQLHG